MLLDPSFIVAALAVIFPVVVTAVVLCASVIALTECPVTKPLDVISFTVLLIAVP